MRAQAALTTAAEAPLAPAGGLYVERGKRWLDVAGALAALAAAAPLIAGVALLVRLRLGSPVLFRQERVGRDGRVFRLLKFRTMTNERDAAGRLMPDDRRLTPVGLFLRRWSLDELPQLVNVLRGEMSLVGPRPLLVRYLPRYTPRQRQRHAVRPGITGWAQVHGRNLLSWEDRFERDLWYVENASLGVDLRILLLTVRAALGGRDVVPTGGADVEEFWGAAGPPPGAPRSVPSDEVGAP
jgi:sugar transferase EpsL